MGHGFGLLIAGVAVAASVGFATVGNATTVDFTGASNQGGGVYAEDGLTFDDIRIVSGNCDASSGKRCGAFNDNETSILTKVGGGTFTLASFWFELLGNGTGNTFFVATNLGGWLSFPVSIFDHNDGGQVVDLTLLALFQDVTWIEFYTEKGGNVRLDDLALKAVAPVPLPAAGLLLAGGLGAMGMLRRRRRAV